MINATATSTYGTVVTSPAGFYAIPSVRIINVPAVTQANGQLACTTSSTWSLVCQPFSETTTHLTTRSTAVFSGMNSGMQNYFSGQQLPTRVTYDSGSSDFYTVSRPATNTSAFPYTTVISFSTPYLHFPVRAATELLEHPYIQIVPVVNPNVTDPASSITSMPSPTTSMSSVPTRTTTTDPRLDTDNVAHGFLPSGIIPWMLKNPDYVAQYPNLASCLPGGPSIALNIACLEVAPATAGPVPDLTTDSAVTVEGVGCFHPGNCPAASADTPTPAPAVMVDAAHVSNTALESVASAEKPSSTAQPEHTESPSQPSRNTPPAVSLEANPQVFSHPKGTTPNIPHSNPAHQGSNGAPAPTPSETANPAQPNLSTLSSPAPTLPVIVMASSTIVLDSLSKSVFDSHTLQQASPSTSPSLPPTPSVNIGAIIMSAFGPHTETPTTQPATEGASSQHSSPPPVITLASQVLTANSLSAFIISSTTLAPGSPAITLAGTTYSLAPSAAAIIINDHTSPLPIPPTAQSTAPIVSTTSGSGTQVVTASSVSVSGPATPLFIISSQTLVPGSPAIILQGTTYSLAPAASAIVINGHTSPLPSPPIGSTFPTPSAFVLTLAESQATITLNSALEFVIGSKTLAPGSPAIEVQGTTYSFLPGASAVVVNGETETLASPRVTLGSNGSVTSGGGWGNGSAFYTPGGVFTGDGNILRGHGSRALFVSVVGLMLGTRMLPWDWRFWWGHVL